MPEKVKQETKFTEEEIKQLQQIQQSYVAIQAQFGQLKMNQIRIDNQEDNLCDSLISLQDEEKKFLDGITKKYGQGSLNPETGVFTPNKSE